MINKFNNSRFTPLLVSLGIVLGIIIGSFYANHFTGKRLNIINNSSDKINSLLHIIDDQYVDSVNMKDLVEKSLPQILKELDPHSVYIPAAEAEAANQDLKGNYSGIGVQFTIYKDTVRVVRIIEGGPSESAGLKAGDRIVKIDGKNFVGKGVNNDETMKRLKGKGGTAVRLGIVRAGKKGLQNFSVTRGDVPLKSIDAVYMADKNTGYIRISNFGDTTFQEFLAALATLNSSGFQNLIIDLRGNLGGYMAPAVQIANEFLPKNRLIVYTEGRKSPREEYRSDGRGAYQSIPLVILADETSASASEILAGAIQDNDRGTVIGRRTFGKGLVQVPIEFNDGSMIRLTKARYYTPSGRCVQKPYVPGDEEEYEQDLLTRAEHGEYYSRDSIKTKGPKFKTRIGRTVYGGGGIIPDIFVSRDTLGITSYFKDVYFSGAIFQFAYVFVDDHRQKISEMETVDQIVGYLDKEGVIGKFTAFAEKLGIKKRNRMIMKSQKLLVNYIYSNIIDDVLGIEKSTEYLNRTDKSVLDALQVFREHRAFPQPPKKTTAMYVIPHNCMSPIAWGHFEAEMYQRPTSYLMHTLPILATWEVKKKYVKKSNG